MRDSEALALWANCYLQETEETKVILHNGEGLARKNQAGDEVPIRGLGVYCRTWAQVRTRLAEKETETG